MFNHVIVLPYYTHNYVCLLLKCGLNGNIKQIILEMNIPSKLIMKTVEHFALEINVDI